jgi:hypothetical protein
MGFTYAELSYLLIIRTETAASESSTSIFYKIFRGVKNFMT